MTVSFCVDGEIRDILGYIHFVVLCTRRVGGSLFMAASFIWLGAAF